MQFLHANIAKTLTMTITLFHILSYRNENHHTSIDVHKFINTSKYSYVSIHDHQGLMMMYDMHMHLDSFNTTSHGS
jgi:hypothetical protein